MSKNQAPDPPISMLLWLRPPSWFRHLRAFIYPAQEHSEGDIINIEIGGAGGQVFGHTQSLRAFIYPDTDREKTEKYTKSMWSISIILHFVIFFDFVLSHFERFCTYSFSVNLGLSILGRLGDIHFEGAWG